MSRCPEICQTGHIPYDRIVGDHECGVVGGGCMTHENDDVVKDRVKRLMTFLREIVETRTAPILDVSKHEMVQWLYPSSANFQIDATATAGDEVLRAPRVFREKPPAIPAELEQWIPNRADVTDSASDGPRFHAGDEAEREARDIERAHAAFTQWRAKWKTWADADIVRRPAAELYQVLGDMMREVKARPESVEVVVTSGLLKLAPQPDDDAHVNTHLVTQEVTIERDEETGDLVVTFVDLSRCRLEDTQLLTGRGMFDSSGSHHLQEQLLDYSSPLDPTISVFYKSWAVRASTTTVLVDETLEPPTSTRGDATLRVSPALILRRRSAFAKVEYYNQMIKRAETDGGKTPLGLAQLVTSIEAEDRVEWLQSTGAAAPAELAQDPLFPLPANPEQAAIINRLGGDSGVVVEGPPGTGKTHTIANLVSALLARGQRVLVTSEKSQALQVLRDKLPADMQELCVSITDLSRGGSQELSRSVATIAARKTSFVPESADRTIRDLESKRDQARTKRVEVLEAIRSLRESETYQHPPISRGYAGTLANVVRKLNSKKTEYSWMPGPLLSADCPLTVPDLTRLVELARTSSPEREARAEHYLPDLGGILPPRQHLADLRDTVQLPALAVSARSAEILSIVETSSADDVRRIQYMCQDIRIQADQVRNLSPALQNLADGVLAGSLGHLWARTRDLYSLCDFAVGADQHVGVAHVEAPPVTRGALRTMQVWLQQLNAGAEWRGRFRRTDEQKAFDALEVPLQVDGEPVASALTLDIAVAHLSALDAVESARHILADLGVELPAAPSRSAAVNGLGSMRRDLGAIESLVSACVTLQNAVREISRRSIGIASVDDALNVSTSAEAIARESQRKAAADELTSVAASLASALGTTPCVEAADLVKQIHGTTEDFDTAIDRYLRAQQQKRDNEEYLSLVDRLSQSAPALCTEIKSDCSDHQWDSRIGTIDDAWQWRIAQDWLDQQLQPGREDKLNKELDAVTADISSLTSQLAAERAWKSCLARMTASEVTALQSYRDHMQSVGKGTGKYAERYRQAARSAMSEAQSAVPAWVMPTQQVLASIPPQQDAFDVVIVDEASQVDLTNLFLLWLAPRVIVVGDDKQCTPSEVAFGELEKIFDRLDNYLPDLPSHIRTTFTPRSSLFSLLRSRFGQVVRLREHFRSMPEIVSWSSNQFYRDAPLVPVRQFGADRLTPLKATYVPGATVSGQNATLTNALEAQALAAQVAACMADPAYEGKTMGVVVLQGQSQVHAIQHALSGLVSETDWEERRFRVGTPPDFQGDERDVIFLSLVVAPEQNFQSLTKTDFQQRFNVGATRAKDQMWLFHSVTVDRLKAGDLRRSLLEHMVAPSSAAAEPMPENVPNDVRVTPFDSLFEQRIFNEIAARGYHVNPQVPVNNRRIDLVVTGSSARLAVECDGDAFHSTPEQIRADLDREVELRRCGWTFWRVRESAYYADPIQAMMTLWDELDSRGIKPLGADVPPDEQPESPITEPPTEPPTVTTVTPPAPEPISLSDNDIRDAILYNVEKLGTIAVDKLASQLDVSEDRVEHIIGLLVSNGELEWTRDGEEDDQETDNAPHGEDQPAPHQPIDPSHTIKKMILAGTWAAIPMTVERAMSISKLDQPQAESYLDELVASGKLKRSLKDDKVVWTRGPA